MARTGGNHENGDRKASSPNTLGAKPGLKLGRGVSRASVPIHLAEQLVRCVNGVLELDGLIGMARTSDGGAVCMNLKVDGVTTKVYASSESEFEALMTELGEALEERMSL